jgi:hypothetical protein
MKTRSLVAASLALLFGCSLLAPASATTTTIVGSANPIVAWSESTTGSITLVPNYTANAVTNPSGFGTIVSATNAGYMGGSPYFETCSGSVAQSGTFINYGVVYAPISTNITSCDYQNALLAIVTTNDTNGWTVTQQLQIAPSTGFTLCALNEQGYVTKTLPLTVSALTSTSTEINESVSPTPCAGSHSGFTQEVIGSQNNTPGNNTLIPYPNATATTTGTFYAGEDMLLEINGTVAATSYTVTMNVTLTLN